MATTDALNGLDMSFLEASPEDKKRQQAQQSTGLDMSFLDAEEEAPPHDPQMKEITGYGQSIPKELKIALGQITSLNPDAQADIVKNNIPNAKVYKDNEGAYVVDINGEKGFINKPGLSPNDFTSFIGNALQYIPMAGLANLGRSLLTKMMIAGPAGYATNQAQQKAARELG